MGKNKTLGAVPPAMARRRRRKVMPSITGIDQSSRMTSGMTPAQKARASEPSAASSTSKPRPSTIRRATFRMIRLSSTIRQVLGVKAWVPEQMCTTLACAWGL